MSRVDNYIARMPNQVTMQAILTSLKPVMDAKLAQSLVEMENIESLVRGTLSGISGVTAPSRSQVAGYQAFAKQCYRFCAKFPGGNILDHVLAATITKWHTRGLSSTVLTQLAYEVFHWSPPAP